MLASLAAADGPAPAPLPTPLDAICGLGQPQGAGCAAIRARSPLDAARQPFSAIGRVNYAGGAIRSHCTGTLVSRRVVLTAGHCLWNGARKRWIPAESLHFVAGYQRGDYVATSRVIRAVLSPMAAQPPAAFSAVPAQDWAFLILADPLGDSIAPLPLFRGKLRLAGPGEATLAGYAGLTPHLLTQARDCGRPLAVGGALIAACSAMPGDSGAPLLWRGDDGAGRTGLFLLGAATAVSAAAAPYTTRFAPWFRLRSALATEQARGN